MDISVRDAKVVEDLRFWKLQEFITIHQACMLATGIDPGNNLFGFEPFIPRSGYEPIKSSLTTKLTEYYYDTLDKKIDKELGLDSLEADQIFCPENIKSATHEGGDDNDIALYRIKQTAIRDWLKSEGIYSVYFESISNRESIPALNGRDRVQNYSTELIEIMFKTIERYYGDNFDFHNKDTYPKQEHVIDWLMTEFSLPRRKAEAIEIIITPRNGNYSEG